MGFTKIDNCWLDNTHELSNAAFRVIMILERFLTGYHRTKHKIPYSKISAMTGVKNVYLVMKGLKEKGFVSFKSESGRASKIQIHKPSQLVSGSSIKASNSVSTTIAVNDTHHSNNLHDPPLAKENNKENLKKESFLLNEFIKNYPEDKIDEHLDAAWQTLPANHHKILVGVLEYQNNRWKNPDFECKYIPKASNYLLKQLYLADSVKKHYDDEIRRKKEAIERRKYLEEADANPATESEIKEILSQALSTDKQRRNNDGKR